MLNNTLVLYIHGKSGTSEEAKHYKLLFQNCDVLGLDYKAETPWDAKTEFQTAFQTLSIGYDRVILIANSIGAYFSMCALPQEKIKRAYFISPIVNMEKLISKMMVWANVTEGELYEKGKIETQLGETLSWEYLCYVRSHPLTWMVSTEILYGEKDNLTDRENVEAFVATNGAGLTIMQNGEHWFHTQEQVKFVDDWIKKNENRIGTQLKTAHLILRNWSEADAASLYEYAKDPNVGHIAGWQPHKSVDESLNIIQNVLTGPECYAICERESGKAIGCIELMLNGRTDMTDKDDECELGYWLGKPFWGRGYMTEAANEILRHAFEDIGMMTVWCGYYDGNIKSKRVQEKLGFVYHHTRKEVPVPLMNEVRKGHTNMITKQNWLKRRNNNEYT